MKIPSKIDIKTLPALNAKINKKSDQRFTERFKIANIGYAATD